ncbi:hypothetical protein [Nostoc sp.]
MTCKQLATQFPSSWIIAIARVKRPRQRAFLWLYGVVQHHVEGLANQSPKASIIAISDVDFIW